MGFRVQGIWRAALFSAAIWLSLLSSPVQASPSGFGHYEKVAVSIAIDELGATIDPNPTGKRIGKISIRVFPVFGKDTDWLQALNRLHVTTKEWIIGRELLVQKGDPWREARIRESERILRVPSFSSFVVIVPLKMDNPEEVELLVVTRDVWSLRTNSEFVHQAGTLTFLKLAAAENNLFGLRKHTSVIFEMDQGLYSLSMRWRDLNVLGKRWQFTFRPFLIFGRESDKVEGSRSFTRLEYPLWSLASKWGSFFLVEHKNAITRNFLGSTLDTFDDPATEEIESLPQEFRQSDVSFESEFFRSFGSIYKQNYGLGHRFSRRRSRFLDDNGFQNVSDATREAFAREFFPRNERKSELVGSYQFFVADFVQYRNVDSFDLPEVRNIGPRARAELSIGRKEFGGQNNFSIQSLTVGYLLDIEDGEGYLDAEATVSHRVQGADLDRVDKTTAAKLDVVTPFVRGLRFRAKGEVSVVRNVQENLLIRIGGQEDLRGYDVGSFVGTSFYRGSLELRSHPQKLWFMLVGGLAFWDVGDAADRFSDFDTHHDLGLGVRALIPQFGESLAFLYWAVPLDRDQSQLPGRFTLGLGKPL